MTSKVFHIGAYFIFLVSYFGTELDLGGFSHVGESAWLRFGQKFCLGMHVMLPNDLFCISIVIKCSKIIQHFPVVWWAMLRIRNVDPGS